MPTGFAVDPWPEVSGWYENTRVRAYLRDGGRRYLRGENRKPPADDPDWCCAVVDVYHERTVAIASKSLGAGRSKTPAVDWSVITAEAIAKALHSGALPRYDFHLEWVRLKVERACRQRPVGSLIASAVAVVRSLLTADGLIVLSEAEALKRLGEREVWGVDELPAGIDADVLRCLDTDGFVEARGCWMQNKQKYPGDPTPPTPAHGQWCSPLKNRDGAGEWDVILEKRTRDKWNHPYEVRASERGRAELARMRREAVVVQLTEKADTNSVPIRKPGGWTRKELVDEAKEKTRFSATVFDKIREAAGIAAGEQGGAGQQRRFTKAMLRKLIAAVEAGRFRYRVGIAAAWRELLDE